MAVSPKLLAAIAFLATPSAVVAEPATTNRPISETGVAPAEAAPQLSPTIRLAAGTIVRVELVTPLNSRTSQIGETFQLRLLEPIVIDGREIVAAGAVGGGEVIDADSAGFGGRQGKLIIAARYLDIGGQRVRIRGMQLTAVGRDRVHTAMGVAMIPYAGIASIFIQGGEIELPAGAGGTARLATEVDILESALAPTPIAQPVERPASADQQLNMSGENQQ